MSHLNARLAFGQLIGRPAFVEPSYVRPSKPEVTSSSLMADLAEMRDASMADLQQLAIEQRATLLSTYGFGEDNTDKPFAFSNGYAMIPIHGALVNRLTASYGYVTGYNFIRSQVQAAMDDDDVTAIVYDVNSYGGAVSGCGETAGMIAQSNLANGGKPSIAVVDSSCFSAAYYLASQADHVAVTPSGMVGSIGVIMMHADMSKMLKDIGIDVTLITAGAHKADGNPFEPLSDTVRADFQTEIDATYSTFVSAVASGRGMDEDDVRGTEARIYSGADALKLGLIDAIQNPADAVEAYFAADDDDGEGPADTGEIDPPDPTNQERQHMPPVNRAAAGGNAPAPTEAEIAARQAEVTSAASTAAAEARTAERTRISAITGHAEATGRAALANHLALNTDMTVEAAAGILAASPKEASAPAPTTGGTENHFQNAMDNGQHPNVGAGNGTGAADAGNVPPAQRILATQAKHGFVKRTETRH